jgi:hypothetical protein
MKVNVNHPSFLSFIDNINNTVMTHSPIENYFTMTLDNKMSSLYVVFRLVKNAVSIKTKLSDDELKSFITVLCKKNEEYENYEFAAILKDIITNFDIVNDFVKPKRKSGKIIKVDKTQNG